MSWRDDIGGGFGYATAAFASHPSDNHRAFQLLQKLREDDVTWSEVESAAKDYLRSKGWMDDNLISEQLATIESLYRPWLRY